jgi:hypothetical protein
LHGSLCKTGGSYHFQSGRTVFFSGHATATDTERLPYSWSQSHVNWTAFNAGTSNIPIAGFHLKTVLYPHRLLPDQGFDLFGHLRRYFYMVNVSGVFGRLLQYFFFRIGLYYGTAVKSGIGTM